MHTIKISFQQDVYKGFITLVKGGNCKGLNVLGINEEGLYDMKFKENPINFRLLGEDDNGDKWFTVTLKNDEKDELLAGDVWEGSGGYIARIETIGFEREKWRGEKILAPLLYIEGPPNSDN